MEKNPGQERYEAIYEIVGESSATTDADLQVGEIARQSEIDAQLEELINLGSVRLIGFVAKKTS